LWSQELDFWGGDFASLRTRLDHVQQLGVDVLYLNPIHLATTNHKYDALDYHAVSPEYGTRDDVKALAQNLHDRGMKLVLDGVFNHMGRNAPVFQQALADPTSPTRDWFHCDADLPGGARAWANAENLPELNMEHPQVRERLYAAHDSVVRGYLRDGIDGWRLDVAHDIGFRILEDLTCNAHDEKPGSLVVGELWTYPQEWFPCVDGVMNFTFREIILRLAQGRIRAATASAMIARTVEDAGVDNLLKSWLMLDNHDVPRLAWTLPEVQQRRLAQVLQFTLPGAPNLYYGSELGMTGGHDPEMRAPMRWDLVNDDNAELHWTRQLIALRRDHRALRVGNFRMLVTQGLLGFERHTDRIEDSVFVLVNPTNETITETVMVPNSKLMNASPLINLLEPEVRIAPALAALLEVSLPPKGVLLVKPDTRAINGYTTYKRVQ
jgi:glycosidase